MRIALFGGTFDPIHRGHLRLATASADAFALDRVLFAPVGHQPLKPDGPVASFADRLAMVRLALETPASAQPSDPRFTICTLDQPRPNGSPNYTVDTLTTLAGEYPGADIFALVGADSFLDLRRWRSPDRLLALAQWIVVSRPEFHLTEEALMPLGLTAAERARVHLLTTVHEEVSATQVRDRLRACDSCSGLLPGAVFSYIRSHHLYGYERCESV